jgi:hypothetical protein
VLLLANASWDRVCLGVNHACGSLCSGGLVKEGP